MLAAIVSVHCNKLTCCCCGKIEDAEGFESLIDGSSSMRKSEECTVDWVTAHQNCNSQQIDLRADGNKQQIEPPAPRRRCHCICGLAGMFVGVLLLTQAFLLPLIIKHMLEKEVPKAILITDETDKNSTKYKTWVDNDSPDAPQMLTKYWFCNVTNTIEVLDGGIPFFNVTGPYTYQKINRKLNVEFLSNGTQVRYIPMQYYKFLPNQSCTGCNDSTDVMTVINPVLFTLLSFLPGLSLTAKSYLKEKLKKIAPSYLYVSRPPLDILFGYEDPVLVELKNDTFTSDFIPFTTSKLVRNDSSEEDAKDAVGYETVLTGKFKSMEAGFYVEWNNRTYIEYWASPLKVAGYGVAQYPPLAVPKSMEVWTPSLFRSLPFEDAEIPVNYYGIIGNRYRVNQTAAYNSNTWPPNKQYYQNGVNGVFNLSSPPPKGVPIFITWRHFSGAPSLARHNKEINLPEPNPNIDEPFVDIEHVSGAAIAGSKPIQINIPTVPGPIGTAWAELRRTMFPMVIFEDSSVITQRLATKFDQIYLAGAVSESSRWWGFLLGPFVLLNVLAVVYCGYYKRRRDREYLVWKEKALEKMRTPNSKGRIERVRVAKKAEAGVG